MKGINILITVISSAATFAGGYILGSKRKEKKLVQKFNNDINELSEYYHNALIKVTDTGIVPDETKNKGFKIMEQYDTSTKGHASQQNESVNNQPADAVALNETINTVVSDNKPIRKRKKAVPVTNVHEITMEAYGMSDNTCETLIYYAGSNIMTDGYGERVVQPEALVGTDGFAKIQALSVQEDAQEDLYFRNVTLGIDYEVEITSDECPV